MGPLRGIRIVEFGGIGPGPMGAMLLAELGATVLRIERRETAELGLPRPRKYDLLLRSRPAIRLDLKSSDGRALALQLAAQADASIEGFRPGVMEQLGLGPETCLAHNPRLVYGRVTGWGQTGPLAQAAGHDLNYIALVGALNAIGQAGQPPAIPLNLLGDFGGGALYLAVGILAGILEARSSGQGQVVDAAMTDGVASLQTMFFGMLAAGMWRESRGSNAIDSGSHFYQVYQCSDGMWISVAATEGRFHADLLCRLGIDPDAIGPQMDPATWASARALLAERFRSRTRDEWCRILEGTDACFAPVLSWSEAAGHPQIAERATLIEVDGVLQPAPAPRFSRTMPALPTAPQPPTSAGTTVALQDWLHPDVIRGLRAAGTID